jgi:hypothetical protein
MPSEEAEFRVGDRVETRRGENIPEDFRQRRAEVKQIMDNGRLKVEFANPPTVDGMVMHHHPGYRWWEPSELRLVERSLRLTPGARVIVSNPAYVYENDLGAVLPEYYGQTCVVLDDSIGSTYPGNFSVRILGGVGSNHCHRKYLTVIEEAPVPKFRAGDLVQVNRIAYSTVTSASRYDRVAPEVAGQVGTIERMAGDGSWYVTTGMNRAIVHERYMGAFVDDEPESRFAIGDVVKVDHAPKSITSSKGMVSGAWRGMEGVVVNIATPSRMVVRNRDGGEQVIHQSHLTKVDFTAPAVGSTVRAHVGGVFRTRPEEAITQPILSRHYGQIGTVTGSQHGCVKVEERSRAYFVHPWFLHVYSAAEVRRMLHRGDRVRVKEDAVRFADGSGQVDHNLLGRVCVVREAATEDASCYYVEHVETGYTDQVRRSSLTKIEQVSTVERCCEGCGGKVKRTEAFDYRQYRYCADCLKECRHCHEKKPISGRYSPSMYRTNNKWECDECTTICTHCRTRVRTSITMRNPHRPERRYCEDCRRECRDPNCSEQAFGGDVFCMDCREDSSEGLGRYRHTHPAMWLGGPVRSAGGYYIGFEHEISASGSYRLKPLRKWATEHLGHRAALDPKPDSSVAGFEIATQPMTPAFFEEVDWESYMEMLEQEYPTGGRGEPVGHGLHVHIGRQAFRTEKVIKTDSLGRPLKKPKKVLVTDSGMLAAFTYLLSRGHSHLERIGRRAGSSWALQMDKPVKAALLHPTSESRGKQVDKLRLSGERVNIPRGAVNLTNSNTIEIRAARSTRSADELKAAVRVVYLAAEYVRHLRKQGSIRPTEVNWAAFSAWVGEVFPEAYASISGGRLTATPVTAMSETLMEAFNPPERKRDGVNMENEVVVPPDPDADVVLGGGVAAQALRRGTRVRVSTPAYATASPDSSAGYVEDMFYGRVCTVLREGPSEGTWTVQDRRGHTNTIHQNWLEVVVPDPFVGAA